jgi:demethylmenaquinone methyltransferase/2-methoxy-6-polyprenyl-1,4-benzoquinol methylase
MFTEIAPRYDLLNHLLSLNIDKRWRRLAVQQLRWVESPGGSYLDLCAGTFDLAAQLARTPGFDGLVVGADFVVPMLEIGRLKAPEIHPVGADALKLPFPRGFFEGCTVGFGIRNLADVDAGLREIARVLKPGGRLVVLEFSTPTAWPIKSLYMFYFRHVLPLIGRLVSKHRTAYSYLPDSVEQFPTNHGFKLQMEANGFHDVHVQRLTFGVASLYSGVVRDDR